MLRSGAAARERIAAVLSAAQFPEEARVTLTRWLRLGFAFWRAVGLRVTGLGGGSAFHLADPFFHLFAGLERDHELLWYKDFIARPGIASLACGPAFYLENTEVPQLNAVVFNQRFDDRIEGLLDDFLRLKLCQTDLLGDGFDNLFLGHVDPL
jgi:hypothetical protein